MGDIITDVTKGKGQVRIVINDESVFWLSYAAFNEKDFAVNDGVDLPTFQEWLLTHQYPSALNKAVGFLAVRTRSSLEVRQKLESKGYMPQTIDLVLYKLEKEHILDDEAFARDWVSARIHRQLGKARILQELRQKGIDRQTAERVCAALDVEEMDEQATTLAVKLLKRHQNEADTRKAMNKVLAAMARRGFSYEEASRAVQAGLAVLQEDDTDEA